VKGLFGWRNVLLCESFLVFMLVMVLIVCWKTESAHIQAALNGVAAVGATTGVSVAGIVFGRAANKKAENGGGS
jgi:hypothetical protein